MGPRLACAFLLLGSACSDLPPIATHTCGNGVIESGEDCDTFPVAGKPCGAPGTPQACAFTCDASTTCPMGFGCGGDGVCRKATGDYHGPDDRTRWRLQGFRLQTGDIDGDENPDLLGFGPAGVFVRFGTGDGKFAESYELHIGTRGLAAFGDIDGDGLTDVAIPMDSGLVAFRGTSLRTMAAIPFAPFDVSRATMGVRAIPVHAGNGTFHDTLVALDGFMCFTNFCDATPQAVVALPGGHKAQDLAGSIPVANLDTFASDDEFALAFTGDSQVTVWEIEHPAAPPPLTGTMPRPRLRQTVTLPGALLAEGVRFVDLDLDGHLDLMAHVMGSDRDHVAVAHGNAFGTFNAAAVDASFDGFDLLCSSSAWPLAVGELTPPASGTGRVDFVGSRAICLGAPIVNFVPTAFATSLEFTEAAIGDFNGDGHPDVATISAGTDGMDVFLGDGSGIFNRGHSDSRNPPRGLRTGDFNGDFITDVAAIEQANLSGEPGQDVSVFFAQPFGVPGAAVPMARFGAVEDMETLDMPLGLSTFDLMTDLLVVARGKSGTTRAAAVLLGQSGKQMLSPYFSSALGMPVLAEIGSFGPPDGFTDLLVVGAQIDFTHLPLQLGKIVVGELRGTATGEFPPANITLLDFPNVQFAPACALITVGNVDGSGSDSVVAVDGALATAPGCQADPKRAAAPRLMVAGVGTGATPVLSALITPMPGSYRETLQVQLADLDRDGKPDLVVTYAGTNAATTDGGVVVYWNSGGRIDVSTATALAGIRKPLAVAPIQADADPGLELAVIDGTGVTLFHASGTHGFGAGKKIAAVPPPESTNATLAVADVNRDGVDDLIVDVGEQVTVYLGGSHRP